MIEMKSSGASHYFPKGFLLGFKFDDPSLMPHGTKLKSPFMYSEGLGKIETYDNSDIVIHNDGIHAGAVVPHPHLDPQAGLWIKLIGVGYYGTIWCDNGTGNGFEIHGFKDKGFETPVTDISPYRRIGRGVSFSANLQSDQAAWYFVRGGGGEGLLRWGSFVNIGSI